MEAPVSFNIWISGMVQGVGFRYAAYREAVCRGIRGFVRNESDGDVYMEVEGAPEAVSQFITWCKKGPRSKGVKEIKTEIRPIRGFEKFEIQ